MKPLREEIANLVTGVGEGLSDSAKDLGDRALHEFREGRVRRGLANALDSARHEIAKKLKPRRKRAKARAKSAKQPKARRKKAKPRPKAKTARRSRKRTTS